MFFGKNNNNPKVGNFLASNKCKKKAASSVKAMHVLAAASSFSRDERFGAVPTVPCHGCTLCSPSYDPALSMSCSARGLLLPSDRTGLWLSFSSFIKINLGILTVCNTGTKKRFSHTRSRLTWWSEYKHCSPFFSPLGGVSHLPRLMCKTKSS